MSDEKKRVPKLRFPEFTEAWERRKFGEIVEKYEDPVKTPTEGYTRLGIRSHAKGTFHSHVEKGKELETAKMFRIAADKFIVNITFGWEHAVAITDENDAGKLVSHRFPQYSFNTGMVPKFFRYLILEEKFKHHLDLSSPGGAGRNRVLKLSDMLEYKMNFPSEVEQKKIAAYFDDLDNLITLHQSRLKYWEELKKGLLQKMFPKKGETRPRIRFPEFNGEWEQRKLGDEATEMIAGGDIDKEIILDKGNYPVIANALTDDGIVGYYDHEYRVKAPAVTVTGRGDVGRAKARNVDFTPVVRLLSLKSNHNTLFLENAINTLKVVVESTGVPQLTVPQLAKYEVYFPKTLEEEKKIGKYFEQLDNLITLHQRKLEHLQKLKKGLLQQMFI